MVREPPHDRANLIDDDGMTLIEMMVALALLAFLLAATASSLIAFMRTTVVNEHRVQATALLNTLQEELQASPWSQAALYDDEIAPLEAVGVDLATNTFEGNSLVLIGKEGCDVDADPSCRPPYAPHEIVTIDDREFELYRIVTEVDRTGDGEWDVRRFTTIVRWEVLGRELEQRFESERAPPPPPKEDTPEVVQFDVTPESQEVDEDHANTQTVSIVARFDRGVDWAEVHYTAVEFPEPEEGEEGEEEVEVEPVEVEASITLSGVTLGDNGLYKHFEGEIEVAAELFPVGTQAFELVGSYDGSLVTATTAVTFLEADGGGGDPPVVTQVTTNKATIHVGTSGANNGRLRCDLVVTAWVDDLVPGSTENKVTANYAAHSGTGAEMTAPSTITGTNDVFTLTFPSGSLSEWVPPSNDQFSVVAESADGRQSSQVFSQNEVTFVGSNSTC